MNWHELLISIAPMAVALLALFKDQLVPAWRQERQEQRAFFERNKAVEQTIDVERLRLGRQVEDRLFEMLGRNTDVLAQLNLTIPMIPQSVKQLEEMIMVRLDQMEIIMESMKLDIARMFVLTRESQPSTNVLPPSRRTKVAIATAAVAESKP